MVSRFSMDTWLAIKSNLFYDIYVSTDSKKIFEISKKKNVLSRIRKAPLAKDIYFNRSYKSIIKNMRKNKKN